MSLKELLQQHLTSQMKKIVTLKDFSNVQTSCREKTDRNNLDALFSKLRSIESIDNTQKWRLLFLLLL